MTAEQSSPAAALPTLRTAAAFAPVEAGWIAVTGADRVRWLNGMITNNVAALRPGEGAYTFLLNAQGRIQGDAVVWCNNEDLLLLETGPHQAATMLAFLDRFIIMDEVELADVSREWHGIEVTGPTAPQALRAIGIEPPTGKLSKRPAVPWRGHFLSVLIAQSPLVPRIEIWSHDEAAIAALRQALSVNDVPQASSESLELLRILEAAPRFGIDIRPDKDLPQETAQTHALHFNKGCYLGQEIVERIRSRGQVHRTFAQFVLTGDAPAAGTDLLTDGARVGVLTTVAPSLIDGEQLALGYVRRDTLERGLALAYGGGTAVARAEASGANTASNV